MKEVFAITSNQIMCPKNGKQFELVPMMELILVHSDGKDYSHNGKKLSSTVKISETRFFVSVNGMKELMSQLAMAAASLNVLEANCGQINQLIKVAEGKEVHHG